MKRDHKTYINAVELAHKNGISGERLYDVVNAMIDGTFKLENKYTVIGRHQFAHSIRRRGANLYSANYAGEKDFFIAENEQEVRDRFVEFLTTVAPILADMMKKYPQEQNSIRVEKITSISNYPIIISDNMIIVVPD